MALTQQLLRHARGLVGDPAWHRLTQWAPAADFDFQALARKIYVKDQDIGVAPLMDYYLMILPYVTGTRSADELQDTGCAPDRGLACWLPAEVVAEAMVR